MAYLLHSDVKSTDCRLLVCNISSIVYDAMDSKIILIIVLIDRFILLLVMDVVRKASIRRVPMAMAEGTATVGGEDEESNTAADKRLLILRLLLRHFSFE